MSRIVMIAAVDDTLGIGRGGDMLYHIGADLRRFKALTMGHPVVMGRRTFESLPNGALPGRRNIVVTRRDDWSAPGAERAGSIEQALALAADTDTVYIIGGGDIYRQCMPLADILELTHIYNTPQPAADTFFPAIDTNVWHVVEQGDREVDPRSGLQYRFVTMRRRS